MEAPITRPTGVHDHLRAGRYHYVDYPGADPVPVEITYIEGEAVVRFLPVGEDQGAESLLREMSACTRWQEHFLPAQ